MKNLLFSSHSLNFSRLFQSNSSSAILAGSNFVCDNTMSTLPNSAMEPEDVPYTRHSSLVRPAKMIIRSPTVNHYNNPLVFSISILTQFSPDTLQSSHSWISLPIILYQQFSIWIVLRCHVFNYSCPQQLIVTHSFFLDFYGCKL